MTPALRTGLYTALKTAAGLDASNVFYGMARQGTAYPYCTFSSVSNPFGFDSGSVFEENYIQFNLFGPNCSALETLMTAIESVFDFGKDTLTVTGYTVVTCVRMFRIGPIKPDKHWQISAQYKIELQKSR